MLEVLRNSHSELLGAIAEMELMLARPEMEPAAFTRSRWLFSRVSANRSRLLRDMSFPEGDQSAARATHAAGHIGAWNAAKIGENWNGYRAAATPFLAVLKKQITTEQRVIYPYLESIAGDLDNREIRDVNEAMN